MHNQDVIDTNTDQNPTWPPALPEQTELAPRNTGEYTDQVYSFKFHGDGSEYFGIWIVNILLTLITFGLYAPWAKVRRLRYFYQNTEFLTRRFDFTGLPERIFIGRLIAIAIWVAIVMMNYWSPKLSLLGFLAIYLAIPWLLRATLRFTARNSKLSNSRFYFAGSVKNAYKQFLLAFLITIVTLGLFAPVAIWLYKRYSLNHLYVGQLPFKLNNTWSHYMGAFYVPAAIGFVLYFLLLLPITKIASIETPGTLWIAGMALWYLSFILLIIPLVQARIYITTWNNVSVGNSQFKTKCTQWRYTWIVASNWLARVFTLGLFTPWAVIRLHRYQVNSMYLYLHDDPDQMINMAQADHSALAEEISDIFDIDISL